MMKNVIPKDDSENITHIDDDQGSKLLFFSLIFLIL